MPAGLEAYRQLQPGWSPQSASPREAQGVGVPVQVEIQLQPGVAEQANWALPMQVGPTPPQVFE